MKKVFLLLLIAVSFGAKAQFGSAASFPVAAITNVDTINNVIRATAGYNALGVEILINKTSGTLAGKALIYQSMDGVNYQETDSVLTFSTTPSWTLGPVATYTNTAYFNKQTVPGVYYMVSLITAGTVAGTEKVYYTLRKNVTQ